MEHDTVKFYRQCVRQLLSRCESLNTERSETELLFDDELLHYMAVSVGWMQQKRIHLCLIHITIRDDFIIIQCNNTEVPVVTELAEMGIPRDK
ncbi:MAG: XisI protein, partial [Desulfobacteraceae bacterium]|nr:XisI protein [Desulfobacteraceae bacterium]